MNDCGDHRTPASAGSLFGSLGGRARVVGTWVVVAIACGSTNIAWAQSSTARALPSSFAPGVAFTVTIAIQAAPGTIVAGLEDAPPSGWGTSNISHSGSFDTQSGAVKWGPFFAPSIPTAVTYDVTSPAEATGAFCFAGTVSFDGIDQGVGGDVCLSIAVPALSEWGAIFMTLAILSAGTLVLRSGAKSPKIADSSRHVHPFSACPSGDDGGMLPAVFGGCGTD